MENPSNVDERKATLEERVAHLEQHLPIVENLELVEGEALWTYDLDRAFDWHPQLPGQHEMYQALRAKAKEFANLIVALTPGCAERFKALERLEEALQAANSAIARESHVVPVPE